jgi:hypothetical protein
VIVAVDAEPATGHEADSLPIIIDRSKWLRHRNEEIVADAGYASDAVHRSRRSAHRGVHLDATEMVKRAGGKAPRARYKTPRGVNAAIESRHPERLRGRHGKPCRDRCPGGHVEQRLRSPTAGPSSAIGTRCAGVRGLWP